jgi:chromosome segregation ATPase
MENPNRRSTAILMLATWLALGAYAGAAGAQTARSGGSASAQLVQQLQQLGSERTALQAENARIKKELADMTKERDTLKAGRAALDQRARVSEVAVARSAQDKQTAEGETGKLKERIQELIAKFRETAQTLKDVEMERATFKQSLETRNNELTECVDKNKALYQLNGEVLTRLEGQGVFSRMASAEPFTKLKRVQLENLIDDYKYRADDKKVTTSPASQALPAQDARASGAAPVSQATGPPPSPQAAAASAEHR